MLRKELGRWDNLVMKKREEVSTPKRAYSAMQTRDFSLPFTEA
jgi:hypothetical protein